MQNQAQQSAYSENKANADDAFISEQDALQRQQLQEQDSAANDKLLMQQEARQKVAEASNNASASNVAGLSVTGLIDTIKSQELQRQQAADTNLDNTLQSLQSQKRASGNTYKSRVASVQKPSGASLAIGIGNAALGGITTYYQMKK
ncbi:putative internal virion protein [Rhizobium phage RHph_I20]|uniref:Putative internal virion protein n=1 Tax=Rhizobium phage RHph_I20 TaxID=2509730 RepID=A0A7S5V0N3_9CAUD|nr:putative internal virion protein [Rhizobium phage RHph_I20]